MKSNTDSSDRCRRLFVTGLPLTRVFIGSEHRFDARQACATSLTSDGVLSPAAAGQSRKQWGKK